MNKIEVAVIDTHQDPGGMMMALAKLTQRGHNIHNMQDLKDLFEQSAHPSNKTVGRVSQLPHGTIKRFCPITIAIVGASRRFLAQARTNQVGFNYVSASLQYSDYTGQADFVVPYEIMEADAKADADAPEGLTHLYEAMYLEGCQKDMEDYAALAKVAGNDAAGYKAPQGLRNILIMQANHQAWDYFIRLRGCSRNTAETQYVTMLIWEALLQTPYGEEFFGRSGADCMSGRCREGKMSCGKPLTFSTDPEVSTPRKIINEKWPLLARVD